MTALRGSAASLEMAGTVIYVDDLQKVLEFYQRAFGLNPKFVDLDVELPGRAPDEVYQFADMDTQGGPLQFATHALGVLMLTGYERPPAGQPAGVEIAFYTSDVAGAFDRAVAAGATVMAPPRSMPWDQTVAYLRSVEGTCIDLCSPIESVPGADE